MMIILLKIKSLYLYLLPFMLLWRAGVDAVRSWDGQTHNTAAAQDSRFSHVASVRFPPFFRIC